ncbi:MAG: daunorubicin ABC transporter permease [Methanobacteriota archaeon]|nr:MAG: daunorubicin ABC transporter permease [Euryarchaeota archaeon]
MSQLEKIYVIWKRDVLRFSRERAQVLSMIFLSLVWLVIFGKGIGAMKIATKYDVFIFPGVIGMILLVISLRSGVSIIRDREFGFLRVIVASPTSRTSIILAKVLGGSTAAVSQGILLMLLSFVVKVSWGIRTFIYMVALMFLISFGLVSLGVFIASYLRSFESFNLVMSLLFVPLFLASSALFPVEILPHWMQTIMFLNPFTYGVDALREVLLEMTEIGLYRDLAVLISFDALLFTAATMSFRTKLAR